MVDVGFESLFALTGETKVTASETDQLNVDMGGGRGLSCRICETWAKRWNYNHTPDKGKKRDRH